MLVQSNSNYFNTNIEDYSIKELYNLLELHEFTRENILLKIHDLTSNIFKNNEPIKTFFFEVQNKLLDYLSDFVSSNNSLDDYLHTNANNNIEVTINDINSISDNASDDSYEDNNTNNTNNTNIETNNAIKESFVDYSKYKTESEATIENYDLYKNLYFNTFFRIDKNVLNSLSTDCKIQLTNSLNNVMQCKLTAINIRKPFLIHTTKANDTFIIKKYITQINKATNKASILIDFSYTITIEKGYYEDFTEMENFINDKFINFTYTLSGNIVNRKTTNTTYLTTDISNKDISNSEFINALSFTINKNTKQTIFDLSTSYTNRYNTYSSTSYTNNFKHYEVDFLTNYVSPYSLATILGYNFTINPDTSNNLTNNYKIISPKTYCILNNPIFFCFRENISTTIETHQLFLKNNISSDKILAKINTHKGTTLNNYYIYEILDNIDNKNNIRKYNGPIHLSDFNIKIIDHFGNLVQSIDEEFTFELEVIIQEKKFQQIIV